MRTFVNKILMPNLPEPVAVCTEKGIEVDHPMLLPIPIGTKFYTEGQVRHIQREAACKAVEEFKKFIVEEM